MTIDTVRALSSLLHLPCAILDSISTCVLPVEARHVCLPVHTSEYNLLLMSAGTCYFIELNSGGQG